MTDKKFVDLRGFIAAVEEIGQLQKIDGADWNLEIGAITEVVAEKQGYALLFDQIAGYPEGFRVLTNSLATSARTALVLGLPSGLEGVEIVNQWRQKLRRFSGIAPRVVDKGPVQENVIKGNDIDLLKFPTPKWHDIDGGRYIGTASAIITRDPDEGWVNLGTQRVMIHNRNTLSVLLVQGKHGRLIMDKYHARGQSCPVAISVGHDPAIYAAASFNVPWGTSEYDFTGWLKGEPVDVIIGEETGLPVPATAEIVIEGEIPPLSQETINEGPFGEWAGYYAAVFPEAVPVIKVKSVMHRNDPIILGAPPLKPPSRWWFSFPVTTAALWDEMEACGMVGIRGVWQLATQWGLFFVVAIKQQYAGHAKQVGLAATACRSGAYGGKFVLVVDDDVDITNAEEVIWAMSTRANVDEIDVVKGVWTSPCDPAVPPALRQGGYPVSSRMIIDACRPYHQLQSYPPVNAFSREYKKEVAAKWNL